LIFASFHAFLEAQISARSLACQNNKRNQNVTIEKWFSSGVQASKYLPV